MPPLPRRALLPTVLLAVVLLSLAGCGATTLPPAAPATSPAPAKPPSSATPRPVSPEPVASATPPATSGGVNPDREQLTEDFPRDAFGDPTTIDNPWFPMVPGTQWAWEGGVNGDEGRISHRVVFTVTDLTKVIDGVRTVVAFDEDFTEGELVEAELAFFAQDDDGTVWHLGQYPEEYEDGAFVAAPTWIAGIHDAKAGITMKAAPAFSAASYSQGWGPEVGWTDRARVFEMDSQTCVPAGCYDGVLVVDEFNRDEPDAHQLKYYAPGVGGVRVGWAGALEKDREELLLVSVGVASADELARIRRAALEMEARAYDVSPEVYGTTDRAVPAD